jgi:hypothetical protein
MLSTAATLLVVVAGSSVTVAVVVRRRRREQAGMPHDAAASDRCQQKRCDPAAPRAATPTALSELIC